MNEPLLGAVILKRAKRKAPKQATKKAGAIDHILTSIALLCCILAAQSIFINNIDGATPKDTKSAKLSKSFPMGEKTCNALAAKPSNISKIAAMPIK